MSFPTDKLHRILFIDIETASAVSNYNELSDGLKKHWDQRFERFLDYSTADQSVTTPSEYFQDKAAIYAEYSKVICISVGYIRGSFPDHEIRIKSFCSDDELKLLTEFSRLLNHFYYDRFNHSICGHNIREFDIPFLCRRMTINQLRLPNLLNISGLKPWQVSHLIDTLDMWKFGDFKHYTSLDLLCQILNVDSPKDAISGKDVSRLFWEGHIDEIVKYCEDDVRATIEIYLKCIGPQGLLEMGRNQNEEE